MIILNTITRLLFPLIVVYGLYITIHGHLTPGGGFPAGAVIATGFILLYLAHIIYHPKKLLKCRKLLTVDEIIEEGALIIILGIILVSLVLLVAVPQALRLTPGEPLSAISILALNLASSLEVMAALSIIVLCYLLLEDEND